MVKTPVIVWTLHDGSPHVIFPDGRGLRDHETLPETPFKIWTNGGHFQALIPTGLLTLRPNIGDTNFLNAREVFNP
jgi:hypothetical protein